MTSPGETPPEPRTWEPRAVGGARWWWVGALVLALLPTWGTWDSPWIAEDAAILAHVHAAPLGDDLFTPQYGLELVRFWRPVVTATWWLQERATGIDPLPLRLFNLAVFATTVVLVGLVVRRLGGGPLAALLAAALAAGFPEQGGTVVWLAGRTDGLVGLLFVATVLAALAERRVATSVLLALACMTKEFAFVLPAWVWLFVAARGGLRAAWRATWPAAVVAAVALGARQLAVGSAFGGYPGGASRVTSGALGQAMLDGVLALGPTLWLLPALVLLGAVTGALRARVVAAGLGAALAALLPLLPLLVLGPLPPQNARLLFVADLGSVLACAGAFLALDRVVREGPPRRLPWQALATLALVAVGATLRHAPARADALEWSAAAWQGQLAVEHARTRAAAERPSPHPLLWDGFPGTHAGAYCLGFGLADRFRAPFEPSARPIWPLQPLFAGAPGNRPTTARADAAGFVDPFEPADRSVSTLSVQLDGRPFDPLAAGARVPVDERVPRAEPDRSPRLEVLGAPAGAALEVVLLTEAGRVDGVVARFDDAGAAATTLSELCAQQLSNGILLGQALIQTADLGATSAYLEVRAVDAGGALLAATLPLRLEWSPDLLDRLEL